MMHDIAMDGVADASQLGPDPDEMTFEELQAHAKKLEGVRDKMFATISGLDAEDTGGGNDDTFG